MNPQQYEHFTTALQRNLETDPRVIGLVAVGSMSGQGTYPDRFSDHDFFVVTHPNEQEWFRTHPEWLPGYGQIAMSYRETIHGVSVLYEDAHLLEFAVFDRDELRLAKINRFRILIDRGEITREVEEIAENTRRWSQAGIGNAAARFGHFLTTMVVGAGRWQRGERLSATHLVKSAGLVELIRLLQLYVPIQGDPVLDNIDPLRRFELAYPVIGDEINAALALEVPACAAAMLEIADRELAACLPDYPRLGVLAVKKYLQAPPQEISI